MIFHRTLLLIASGLLFSLGVVMIFNTSSAEVLDHSLERSVYYDVVKQILYSMIGLFIAFGIYMIGYQQLIKASFPLLLFFSFLLLLTFIPGIGIKANGANRWIGIAGFSMQPSEFIKYIIPLYFIQQVKEFHKTEVPLFIFIKILIVISLPLFLIFLEPNNGTVLFIIISVIALCLLTNIKWKYWATPLASIMLIGGVLAMNMPYVSARVKVYLNPELDIRGKGHQAHQAKIAAGSGGFFGKGPGKSLQKLSYLPEAQNDYIAAIYAEEFGFLGVLSIILLYMLITYCGFYFANRAPTLEGLYLASITSFLISFQAFLNLGVVSGILPSTGVNLPLFSQGGSSLMASFVGISILLSISKVRINKKSLI